MPLPAEETGHARFARDFRGALGADRLPQGATAVTADGRAPDPAALRARFAVYRNNVMHSLSSALARRFPVVQRLVGAEFFAALAVEFIRDHAPRSPVLLHWGDAFPCFLREFPPLAGLPYLNDVARIEYARGQAYHAADIQPLGPELLAGASDPGALRLRLAPSLRLLDCAHPAVTIWTANQPGGNPAVRANGPEWALIWRQRDFQVPVRRITAEEAAFLAALVARHPLAQAAEHIPDPTPTLAMLISEGLIAEALI